MSIGFEGLARLVRTLSKHPLTLSIKDSYFKAFGPKDPIIYGFWAILMLGVRKR